MGALVLVLAAIVLLPLGIILDGWAISVLWNWFAVPYLHAPAIGIVVAIGLKLTWATFSRVYDGDKRPAQVKKRDTWDVVGYALGPLIAVGMGWFVRLFL